MRPLTLFLIAAAIPCGPSASKSQVAPNKATSDSVWRKRLLNSPCRRPSIKTLKWPEFAAARRTITVRIPPSFRQDPYDPALKTAGARTLVPPSASAWGAAPGIDFVQLTIGRQDSVKLVFPGPRESEESLCLETIDGANATIASYKWTIHPGDDGYLGPYIVFANVLFQDGLALRIFGQGSTKEQQDQMLAVVRSIRRMPITTR
jgi:hypothetical protein